MSSPRVELRHLVPTPLEVSLPRLMTLVSPYVGVVTSVNDLLVSPNDARQFLAVSGGDIANGSAVGFDRNAALAAAVGEAAERYSASHLPESLPLRTARQLDGLAVDPSQFALFHPAQYKAEGFLFAPFTEDTVVRWTQAFSLDDGAPAYLPAQECLMLEEIPADEEPVAYPTTSGLALAATLEEAVLGGLLEVAERDAFMLVWHNCLSLPLLDWSSEPTMLAEEARYFEPSGLDYAVVDLSGILGIPTALALVIAPGDDPVAVALGAASAATIEAAWRKALSEAFHTRSWLVRERFQRPPGELPADPTDLHDFDDHVLLYCDPAWASKASFLYASEVRRDVREVPPLEGESVLDQMRSALARLRAHGATAYGVDLTSPDIEAAGLRVAKVISPQLCSLYVEGNGRFLGGDRLYQAPCELGLLDSALSFEALNPFPHPFP
jgi:ribosomal protein S12 methylthiotransferase accessory factor